MASSKSQWRALSDVVSSVLRDVRVVAPVSVERPMAAKLK